jgi:hypothetical protein
VALQHSDIDLAARTLPSLDHLRRCTFRRISAVRRGSNPVYDVECLYPDRLIPLPLGDLLSARPVCEACMAEHIFRPDED